MVIQRACLVLEPQAAAAWQSTTSVYMCAC